MAAEDSEPRNGPAPGGHPPPESAASQQEIAQLRTEVTELRAQLARSREAAGAPRRSRMGWRGPLATILIVLGCLLAPLSVLAVWSSNQISNTDRYVQNVAPLINQPAVQRALTDELTTQITRQLNVQALTKQAAGELSKRGLSRLGTILSSFSGSIASGVQGFVHSTVARVVASPAAARLWVQANRIAHTELVKVLSGQASALKVSNGQVVISLGPLIKQTERNLADRGLTIATKLPPINPTFALFSAKYLVQAQSAYRLLNTLRWVLPIAAIIFLLAGVYVARRHLRALVGVGLGLAASMVVLAIALAILRTTYLNSVANTAIPADAAAVTFDTLIRYIKDGLRMLLVLGLVIAFAGFFTGSSATAVKTRHALRSGFGAIRGTGERAGISTGPVGTWVYRYRVALRIAAVVVAALVFVFWPHPTGVVVLVTALILLAVIGLIELIGRPPAGRSAEALAGAGGGAGPSAGAPGTSAAPPSATDREGTSADRAADQDSGSRNGAVPRPPKR